MIPFEILQEFETAKAKVPSDTIIPVMRGSINKDPVYIGYQNNNIFYLRGAEMVEVPATPENITKAFATQGLELKLSTAVLLATQALEIYEGIRYTVD